MSIETTLLGLGYTQETDASGWTLTSPDGTKAVTVSPSPAGSGLYHYTVSVTTETTLTSERDALKLLVEFWLDGVLGA